MQGVNRGKEKGKGWDGKRGVWGARGYGGVMVSVFNSYVNDDDDDHHHHHHRRRRRRRHRHRSSRRRRRRRSSSSLI